jgi:hypothetical protein
VATQAGRVVAAVLGVAAPMIVLYGLGFIVLFAFLLCAWRVHRYIIQSAMRRERWIDR